MRFPLAGVDRTMGFDRQPVRQLVNGDYARTTVKGVNVRAFDPTTDRARGGCRPGIAKYATNQVNTTSSIQDLNYITVPGLIAGGTGTVPGWGIATPHIFVRKTNAVELNYGVTSSAWSLPSSLYGSPSIAAIGNNAGSTAFAVRSPGAGPTGLGDVTFWEIYKNGAVKFTGLMPGNPSAPSVSVATDGTSFYAVGLGKGTTSPGVGTVWAIKVEVDGTVTWSNSNIGSTTNNAPNLGTSTVVIGGQVYTCIPGTGVVKINATTGAAAVPFVFLSQATITNTGTGGAYKIERGRPNYTNVDRPYGIMAAAGNKIAIAVESLNLSGTNFRRGVVFYDVAALTFTPSAILGDSLVDVNLVIPANNSGNFLSVSSDGTNFYAIMGTWDPMTINRNNYVVKITTASGLRAWSSYRFGGGLVRFGGTPLVFGLPIYLAQYSASLSQVIVSGPAVSTALNSTTGIAESGGLGVNIHGMFDAGLINDSFAVTADDGETVGGYNRALCLWASAGGTSRVLFQNVWRPVLAGTGTLSTTAKVIRSAVNRNKLYIVDDRGGNYTIYNPTTNTLDAWTATSGALPVDGIGKKARLICTWRGRTILSGLPEDPSNVFASKQNDSTNWNYNPVDPSATDAWALNTAGIGLIPDVVTALIPYSDDYLFVGCDHEIWRLSGDPRAGGKVDMVSRQLGIAWGNAWCTDASGNLYIFANNCGVYTLSPNEQPLRISQSIDPILREIDLRKVIVRMAWDDRRQGMRIFVTHIAGSQPDQHYFWEQRTGAWWVDQFDETDHNPLCCLTFQGETGSGRVTIIGSWDGYVRFESDSAPNDDGEDINFEVWYGPLLTKDLDELLMKDTQWVLGKNSSPVNYAVHVGNTAEEAFFSTAKEEGSLLEGRSFTLPTRWAGHAIYTKLTGSDAASFETSRYRLAGTGATRRRGV